MTTQDTEVSTRHVDRFGTSGGQNNAKYAIRTSAASATPANRTNKQTASFMAAGMFDAKLLCARTVSLYNRSLRPRLKCFCTRPAGRWTNPANQKAENGIPIKQVPSHVTHSRCFANVLTFTKERCFIRLRLLRPTVSHNRPISSTLKNLNFYLLEMFGGNPFAMMESM